MSVPFLPLFLFDLGVDDRSVNVWAGVVHSTAFFVGAVMAPIWGSVADKYGRKKMVIRAGICLAVIYALIAFVRNPVELVIVRVLHGLAGGFVPASMSIVAGAAPKEKLGWSLGVMQAGTMSGGILGPLIGGLLSTWFGYRMSFIVAGAIIFIASAAVIFFVHEGGEPEQIKRESSMRAGFAAVAKNKSLAMLLLLLLLFQMSYNMFQPFLSLHIANLTGSVENASFVSGFIFALIGIAGIIASPLWGKAGERRGRRQILAVCLAGSGVVVASQLFIYDLWLFTVVQFAFGLFMAGIVPTVNTLMVNSTPAEFRGRSFGLTASANQFGATVGPLFGGALGAFLSLHWIFAVCGFILLGLGIAVWTRLSDASRSEAQTR